MFGQKSKRKLEEKLGAQVKRTERLFDMVGDLRKEVNKLKLDVYGVALTSWSPGLKHNVYNISKNALIQRADLDQLMVHLDVEFVNYKAKRTIEKRGGPERDEDSG